MRFDVPRAGRSEDLLLVDVQADFLDHLATRSVIPLVPVSQMRDEVIPQLMPTIRVHQRDYILKTPEIAAFPARRLGPVIANIEAAHCDRVTDALDFLFQGF